MRFPGADIVELYSHRWEIELGYREMKHSLQHTGWPCPARRRREYGKSCGAFCWRTTCCAARW